VQWQSDPMGRDGTGAAGRAHHVGDDGWRWNTVEGSPRRAIIFPDPLLGRPGPVFEVGPYDIHRRDSADAAAYSIDGWLAALLAMHECVARFAQASRASGIWNGAGNSLGALIAEKWPAHGECRGVRVYTSPDDSRQPWEFSVASGAAMHGRFQIVPDSGGLESPYRFVVMANGRGFMRDTEGHWHVRIGGIPNGREPPPPRCLFDLTIPCEGPPG
jgi:hypothetical protein